MENAFVILGEASESDEEVNIVMPVAMNRENSRTITKRKNSTNKGIIVVGEASESESENEEDACREAFFAKSGAVQNNIDEDHQDSLHYDSLLHKKLRESNEFLRTSVCSQTKQSVVNGVRAVNNINQQLLVTQVHVQDAATALGKAFENVKRLSDSLNSLLATPYIPEINIQ